MDIKSQPKGSQQQSPPPVTVQSSRDECQAFACAIQSCLQKNDFQQDKCEAVIERMLDCCELNQAQNWASCDGFKFQVAKRKKLREAAGAGTGAGSKSKV